MRHYSKVEWLWFINNDADTLLQQKMQEHLLICDECMELYSELLEEITVEELPISEDFTEKVMDLIHHENLESSQRKLKQKRINTLIYYASAASITLFLMKAGAFQDIYSNFASGQKYTSEASEKQSLFVTGWTNRLTDVTSKLINVMNDEK